MVADKGWRSGEENINESMKQEITPKRGEENFQDDSKVSPGWELSKRPSKQIGKTTVGSQKAPRGLPPGKKKKKWKW